MEKSQEVFAQIKAQRDALSLSKGRSIAIVRSNADMCKKIKNWSIRI